MDRADAEVTGATEPQRSWWTRAQESGLFTRAMSLSLALSSLTALGIARWLTPSATGHGTHMELGLGQCTILSLTGWPCPMCGCTTSWALMAHGHPLSAFWNQPFGSLLFFVCVGVLAISTAEVVQPRARWSRLSRALAPWDPWIGGGALLLMFLGWIWKVALMRPWM